MFMRRIIISLLTLTILFSNMASAMDECALFTDISEQNMSQATNTPSDDGSVKSACDAYCIGWAQLLYISYRTSSIKISNSHFDVIPHPSFYHSLQRKPLTAPPQIRVLFYKPCHVNCGLLLYL